MRSKAARWERVAQRQAPSWYLDPLVARQKRQLHLELAHTWAAGCDPARVLKTDVFEDAYGDDSLLAELVPGAKVTVGMDVAPTTVRRARSRGSLESIRLLVADARTLPLRPGSIDLIFSNSTLDHFDSAAELRRALSELAAVLVPGGRLIITLDNLWNPLYLLLRLTNRLPWTPFHLGYTTSQAGLVRALEEAGLEVLGRGTLIHNPRGVSTVLFLVLRRLLGRRADGPIRGILRLFAGLEHLPTRQFTACFVTACARKPVTPPGLSSG